MHSPQDGDIVVSRQPTPGDGFDVRRAPGAVQCTSSDREEAVRLALSLGRRYQVDVWFSDGGSSWLVVERHRATRRAPSALPQQRVTTVD
jgi:hypothetical protein